MPRKKAEDKEKDIHTEPVPNSKGSAVNNAPHGSKEHAGGQQTEPKESKTNNRQAHEIRKVDIIEAAEANTIANTANNISRWAVSVNGLILAVTACLALVAVHQYTAANDAAQTAKNTLTETKRFDSITLANQKTSNRYADSLDSVKSKHDDSVFNYQKKSLNAQIASLKATQNEFESDNQSYLQVDNFDTVTFQEARQVIKFRISNLSNQPAKLISGDSIYGIGFPKEDITKAFKEIEKKLQIISLNKYIIKESPQIMDATNINHIGYKRNMVLTGKMSIHVCGDYIYKNLITNKLRRYCFTVEFMVSNNKYFNMIRNENTDFHKK